MSRAYIESHFADIQMYGSVIEARLDDTGLDKDELMRDNERNLQLCIENGCEYILIEDQYQINL